jgi:hypothetical protein
MVSCKDARNIGRPAYVTAFEAITVMALDLGDIGKVGGVSQLVNIDYAGIGFANKVTYDRRANKPGAASQNDNIAGHLVWHDARRGNT